MEHPNALALDISNPVKAINHICNIDQSVFGIDYLQEVMARAADFLGFPYALIGRPDPSNIACIRTEVPWARRTAQEHLVHSL